MREEVIETFVKARKNKTAIIYCILIAIAALAVAAVIYYFYRLIGFLLIILVFAIAFYGMVLIMKYNNLEYEFSIVMGEFTISEIRNQTRRKKVMSFLIKDLENFKKVKTADVLAKKDDGVKKEDAPKVLYCFGDDDEEAYAFTARSADEGVVYEIYIKHDDQVMKEMALRSFEVRRVLGKI